jgi:uncharacterized membrane protein (DUF4010 family)
MRFVLISLVVLPLLPDRTYGPFGVLNPFDIWRMVVLIVGIGLAGYAAYRIFGPTAGSALAGILGGFVSSTATTVSYARQSRLGAATAPLAAVAILLASAVVFLRVFMELAAVAPRHLRSMVPPLGLVAAALAAGALAFWRRVRQGDAAPPPPGNPAQLRVALLFGGLYALVVLALAGAKRYLGESGLYLVAALSGLTDMDAITLSTGRMVAAGTLAADTAWRLILVAILSNLAFKACVVALLGSRALLHRVALVFLLGGFAPALAVFWLWR